MPNATLTFDARRVTNALFATIAVLQLLHLLTVVARFGFDQPFLHGFVPMFDTDHEKNVPTYFSALNMLLCAQLLAAIAIIERRRASPAFAGWVLLTVIFVLLPFDELFELHERIGRAVKDALHTSGAFGYAWVIPYGIVTIVTSFLLLHLLAKAPADTRWRLIIAGAVFVSGAIGCEMIGSVILERNGGEKTLLYACETTVEEFLEMSGIAWMTRALLLHLARYEVELQVVARPAPVSVAAGASVPAAAVGSAVP